MNSRHGIYVDMQKGFIKKTNGCSEHGIKSNKLFHDVKKRAKDLIVTTIDFTNAFGSIPLRLSILTL
jgi:hypothetical protein